MAKTEPDRICCIDLNADLGEGSEFDEQILALVTSANIACGGHAGDTATMHRALLSAQRHQVAIGAHPSFPDRENFGRRAMQIPPNILRQELRLQIHTLAEIAATLNLQITHIKPHGALYNQAAYDSNLAMLIIELIQEFDTQCRLFALAGSPMVRMAREAGLHVVEEAFADRRYQGNGSLVPRSEVGAVIDSIDDAVEQSIKIVQSQTVSTIEHFSIPLHADSLCVHGDGVHALDLIQQLRQEFARQDIAIRHYLI